MDNIEELIDGLVRDALPVKPALHPAMLSLRWVGLAIAYLMVAFWIAGFRPDLMQKFHEPQFVIEVASLAVIFLATSLSAAVLAFPDVHQMEKVALAPVGVFLVFVGILFVSWLADTPPAPLPLHSYECTLCITLFSLLPAGWTFYSMRKFASTHHRWAGSIALLSSFSVGALWLRLYEVNDSITHVIEWHYLPMLGIGMVGWWLGKKLLQW